MKTLKIMSIIISLMILFMQPAQATESKNDRAYYVTQLTDYCSKYSKSYVEQYLNRADNLSSLTDDQMFALLGDVYYRCLDDESLELRKKIGYNFQNDFYLY
jgi:hypothetical protein